MATPITLGILAHVDAGKTTLSEQLLYRAGAIRKPGRVDHGATALDVDEIERARGITVFSDQWQFELDGLRVTLMDTPGHVDFTAETERAMLALDVAVLLIDGGSGVQPHTAALFRLAEAHGVPLLLFINKTDLPAYNAARTEAQIHASLTERTVRIVDGSPDGEQLALLDDSFCEAYLAGSSSPSSAWEALKRLFDARGAYPLLTGAALAGTGVDGLLNAIRRLSPFDAAHEDRFHALVYKVRHEDGGERVTFLKILGGTLRPRDAFRFGDVTEKVHQIRLYRGAAFSVTDEAEAGDAVGVTGLTLPRCGGCLQGETLCAQGVNFQVMPALSARVEPPDGTPPSVVLEKLRLLEDEDPMLGVSWDAASGSVLVQIMGLMQMEVLAQRMHNRFGLDVRFLPPRVLYKETIAAHTVGCGHYEPLRHYAEVHLRLSPGPRGSGVAFASRCHVDDLPLSYQNLVRTHIFEKTHRGILTGSPLTDVLIELLSGRAHLKHTEGGDFREATYRAIRQGLEKAESVLLEPFYRFSIVVPAECLGRVMTDVTALHGRYDPPETLCGEAHLTGRGPASRLMDYPAALRAYTHGRGVIQLQMDGYDLCHNPDEVMIQAAYDRSADTENPSFSVFCSHGAGYTVPWNKADALMHLPVED